MVKKNSKRQTRKPKKREKFKIPPGFIIGGIFFLIIMIIVAAIINLKVDGLKLEVKNREKILKEYSQIEDTIKLILFDNELDKEHLKKETDKKPLTFKLSIPQEKINTIKSSITSAMAKRGMKNRKILHLKMI